MSECEHGTWDCTGKGDKHACVVRSTPERMKLQIAIRALKQYEAGALSPEWARRALIAIAEIDG